VFTVHHGVTSKINNTQIKKNVAMSLVSITQLIWTMY